ncbi:MAG: ribonuclease [Candidatus Parcubacteria bacterium]|jgi:ribonuclease R|nr:ribonuclease [Candidatus Parcubacteria bacterium]
MNASTKEPYEGPITITRTGKGFFTVDPEKEDLFIPGENLGGAFPGDIVKVEETGMVADPRTGAKRMQGKVVKIVRRSRTTFVGKLVRGDEIGQNAAETYLLPDWKKMYVPFLVRGESLPHGQKVVVRLVDWPPAASFPAATLEEIIGPAGEHETEMRALALGSGFRSDFPPGVVTEAQELEKNGTSMLAKEAEAAIKAGTRRDFRGTTTFTIDPFTAKDFDDALSVKKLENGNTEVGIHIADVSFFVKPGTSIDDEARSRATSVYMVDRTIPMLPEILSTDLCSLNPNEDRLSVSAVFELDADARVVSRWYGETVMHSDKRFTYENAQEVLDKQEGELLEELNTLNALAGKLRTKREKAGAIAFDTPEVKIELDAAGKPINVHLYERRDTNLLIEDFMLLANEEVAEYLGDCVKKEGKQHESIYRVHDVPDADRIANLSEFLKVLGYHLDTHGGKVKGADINALLAQVKGKPEEYLIKMATLRSMSKAVYTTKNIGHYGLAFTFYTHFTSPIRRYPDVLIHRMVKHFANHEPMTDIEFADFEELALHSSEREVSATEAERDSIKMKQVEYLENRIGEEFDAVISGVSDRGLYVELVETRAEGMARMRDIGNDYFTYDEKRYRLVGERTKKEYRLGDPVRVKLLAARVPEKELDFTVVEKTPEKGIDRK